MAPPVGFSEDGVVEKPAIEVFKSLSWKYRNLYEENMGLEGDHGRDNRNEVILRKDFFAAIKELNPSAKDSSIDQAFEEVSRDRSVLNPVNANKEVYDLLKTGFKAKFENDDGDEEIEEITLVDWENPERNQFLVTAQIWISGEMHVRRPDLVGFVNGIPLVLCELKAPNHNVKEGYDDNLRDYKDTIPQLFWYNAICLVSNGLDTKVGSFAAPWEHFFEWKKVSDEEETPILSIETAIRGLFDKKRLVDYLENFIMYSAQKSGTIKILAKNHQFHGVNNAIEAVKEAKQHKGKLGVFWHTQGSGKSFSMIFFSQKVLRKISGKYSFVVVTDRDDLDEQIYKNFASVGACRKETRADSAKDLRKLLSDDNKYVFTLIQKFRTDEKGGHYPVVSDRDDIIVMADEAHRTQYDVFALNMRNGLPNASFIGFTGTPLVAGEEKTKEVFGDYVSVYNFQQSIQDKATVPLYYENRIPELQIVNENYKEDIEQALDDACLNEEEESRVLQRFSKEYYLITRKERLERIAEDIVSHFVGRGYLGKAMYVAIDRFTAVRMHDLVKQEFQKQLANLKERAKKETDPVMKKVLANKIKFIAETDQAVIVSSSQNEIDDFKQKSLDIGVHRKRLQAEDLETKFKDSDDPLRIAFVCAMWITGFDCPACSTIYLDKPMKNHTLMQTIARANRLSEGKESGLIVDYIGIFRNLEKALAIYGSVSKEDEKKKDHPAQSKDELVFQLESYIGELNTFLEDFGVNAVRIAKEIDVTVKLSKIAEAVEALLESEQIKREYKVKANMVISTFKRVLPDQRANTYAALKAVYQVIRDRLLFGEEIGDLSEIEGRIAEILDESIAAESYKITDSESKFDLSGVDFEALKEKFKKGRRRTAVKDIEASMKRLAQKMLERNRTRQEFYEKFMALIEAYNSGSINVEQYFNELCGLWDAMQEEQKRASMQGMSEEELAIFDLLTKPDLELTDKEKAQVKKVAKSLLKKIQEKLVIHWKRKQQAKAALRVSIEEVLDEGLPESAYGRKLFSEKCEAVYQHVFDTYGPEGESPYGVA
jgi:type I restriction enzyme R subunit